MISDDEFQELKSGDRVKTNHSGEATVTKGIKEIGGGKMVRLNCDKKRWSCPYFYQSEIECKLKQHTV